MAEPTNIPRKSEGAKPREGGDQSAARHSDEIRLVEGQGPPSQLLADDVPEPVNVEEVDNGLSPLERPTSTSAAS